MKPICDGLVQIRCFIWTMLVFAPLLQADTHEFELGYQYQTFTHQPAAFLPPEATQADGFLGYRGRLNFDALSLYMDTSLYLGSLLSIEAISSKHSSKYSSKNSLEANQLYVATDVSDAVSMSLGRQYLAWDYGYGWRLFDVFGRKGSAASRSGTAQGADLLQWQYWGQDSALDLLCAWDSEPLNNQTSTSVDTSLCGARWYGSAEIMDWQALALTSANKDSLGVSGNGLVNDATSVFMSVLADAQGQQIQQGEVGVHWTHASGVELTVAGVYDAVAASAEHWQDTLEAHQRQSTQSSTRIGLTEEQAEIVRFLQAPRLTRYQALVRLSYLQNDWDNSLAWVSLPSGLGHIFDTQVGYQWSEQLQLAFEWQHFVKEAALFSRHSSAVSITEVLPSSDKVLARLLWQF